MTARAGGDRRERCRRRGVAGNPGCGRHSGPRWKQPWRTMLGFTTGRCKCSSATASCRRLMMRSRRSPSPTSSAVCEARARAGLRRPRATVPTRCAQNDAWRSRLRRARRARRPEGAASSTSAVARGSSPRRSSSTPMRRSGASTPASRCSASHGSRSPARCRCASGPSRGGAAFRDAWFERAAMWLVVHLVDRPRAFAEARRVTGSAGGSRSPPSHTSISTRTGSTPCFRGSPRSTARAFLPRASCRQSS